MFLKVEAFPAMVEYRRPEPPPATAAHSFPFNLMESLTESHSPILQYLLLRTSAVEIPPPSPLLKGPQT